MIILSPGVHQIHIEDVGHWYHFFGVGTEGVLTEQIGKPYLHAIAPTNYSEKLVLRKKFILYREQILLIPVMTSVTSVVEFLCLIIEPRVNCQSLNLRLANYSVDNVREWKSTEKPIFCQEYFCHACWKILRKRFRERQREWEGRNMLQRFSLQYFFHSCTKVWCLKTTDFTGELKDPTTKNT